MKAIKIIAAVLVFVVLGLAVKAFFFPSSDVAKTISECQQSGEMQVVTLSWGKLNYNPEVITVKKCIPVKLIADTDRLQGCFRSIRIPELGIAKSFTESDNVVVFTPENEGTFPFGCAMGMGRGELVVE